MRTTTSHSRSFGFAAFITTGYIATAERDFPIRNGWRLALTTYSRRQRDLVFLAAEAAPVAADRSVCGRRRVSPYSLVGGLIPLSMCLLDLGLAAGTTGGAQIVAVVSAVICSLISIAGFTMEFWA